MSDLDFTADADKASGKNDVASQSWRQRARAFVERLLPLASNREDRSASQHPKLLEQKAATSFAVIKKGEEVQHAQAREHLGLINQRESERQAGISKRDLREALGSGDLILGALAKRSTGKREFRQQMTELADYRESALAKLEGRKRGENMSHSRPDMPRSNIASASRLDRRDTPFRGDIIDTIGSPSSSSSVASSIASRSSRVSLSSVQSEANSVDTHITMPDEESETEQVTIGNAVPVRVVRMRGKVIEITRAAVGSAKSNGTSHGETSTSKMGEGQANLERRQAIAEPQARMGAEGQHREEIREDALDSRGYDYREMTRGR